jgi:hypothetical protein
MLGRKHRRFVEPNLRHQLIPPPYWLRRPRLRVVHQRPLTRHLLHVDNRTVARAVHGVGVELALVGLAVVLLMVLPKGVRANLEVRVGLGLVPEHLVLTWMHSNKCLYRCHH